uniref:Uncharacterized protein n=1 Tax=Rhinopithecus bieti TaxID=61621 RepID=A0A2K6LBC2_RHIBE
MPVRCHSVCVSHPPLWKEPASKGFSELPGSQPSLGCQGPGLGPALTLWQPREADWAMNAPSPGASLFHRHPGSRCCQDSLPSWGSLRFPPSGCSSG